MHIIAKSISTIQVNGNIIYVLASLESLKDAEMDFQNEKLALSSAYGTRNGVTRPPSCGN